jgi:hypothetical protein
MCGKKATGIRKKKGNGDISCSDHMVEYFYVMISGNFFFVQKLAGI